MAESDSVDIEVSVEPAPARGPRDLWQVPVLAVGAALMISGMATAWVNRPRADIDAMLRRADVAIQAGEYDAGLEILNTEVRAHTGDPGLFNEDMEAAFHLLRARALYLGQRHRDLSLAENHERVLKEYDRAERIIETLPPEDVVRVAGTLMELDRLGDASERAASLPDSHAVERIEIRRALVERYLAGPEEESRAMTALTELSLDPRLTANDEAWVAAREAEIRIQRGFFDDTIARLLRVLPTLGDADPWLRAELFLLLGEAYELTGDSDRATEQLTRAGELIPDSEPMMGRVLLAEARVLFGRGEFGTARELLDRAVRNYASTRVYLPSVLMLAHLESAEENHPEAAAMYRRAVDELASLPVAQRVPAAELADEITERGQERLDEGVPSDALQYAELAERVTPGDDASTDLVRLLAEANRARATEIVRQALAADIGLLDLADVDPVTRNAAREHFARAATYYRQLGDRVIISDNASYADALWNTAQSYDLAGDQDQAIITLTEFVTGFPGHPRLAEARYRLARSHLSRGEYQRATDLYTGLIADAQNRETGRGVGPFADRSYVPLARAYLLDSDPSNDSNAEELLLRVLRGTLGGTESPVYLEALGALAGLYYDSDRLPEAIERLEEAVERSPEGPRVHALRYRLADAKRREAGKIAQTLSGSVPDTLRAELTETRRSHLRDASALFATVRDDIDEIDPRIRRQIDELYLRNAHFYHADCLFDLDEHQAAIKAYSEAQRRYAQDPSSLVAHMQVFNAYVDIGEFDKARTAQARAKKFYESLDPAVWDDPLLPLSREDWEQWLDATHELARAEADKLR